MVQMCVQDERGVGKFIDQMRRVAESEGMKFIDNSERTQVEIEKAKNSVMQLRTNGRAINLAIEGDSGLGMTAGNLGLPRYQIVIGFSAGVDSLVSRGFSAKVIEVLSSLWLVEELDNSQGAKPMRGCE